ncbi:MAG: NAD-dependent epimerase/dehydratase family protein [Firmicutes bacterium]|nr:NAD-dependent epimerase/dehydratase family protein [Bacillota bacterium]
MKILVTGGAGFIGSHVVDKLLAKGNEVAVVDNLYTGKLDNINPRAKFYKMDILSGAVSDVFDDFRPQIVIHSAAQIDIAQSLKDPFFDAAININGTIRILEACRQSGVQKIIYSSSAAVYGDPKYLPVDEQHPAHPLSYYGISKYAPEHYIRVCGKRYGILYTILRYANVYGVRQDPKGEGGVISIFLNKMMNGEQPTIFGDGAQTRDFVYIEDVARANIAAVTSGNNKTINISTNRPTSVATLFELMKRRMKSGLVPVYGDEREGDIKHSCLDNKKAKKYLNWEPRYELSEGLAEIIDYYYTDFCVRTSEIAI